MIQYYVKTDAQQLLHLRRCLYLMSSFVEKQKIDISSGTIRRVIRHQSFYFRNYVRNN